jgi:hypothetical protein
VNKVNTVVKNLFNIKKPKGIDPKELELWNQTFGSIPAVLLDYYTELGAYKFNRVEDYLIEPDEIPEFISEYPGYLVFYSENQSVTVRGISAKDVFQDDPPVFETQNGAAWWQVSNSINDFLLSMAYWQAIFYFKYSSFELSDVGYIEIDESQKDEIGKAFASKNADCGVYTGMQFFGDETDCVIAVLNNNDNYILMFASSNKTSFNEMKRKLSGICDCPK